MITYFSFFLRGEFYIYYNNSYISCNTLSILLELSFILLATIDDYSIY